MSDNGTVGPKYIKRRRKHCRENRSGVQVIAVLLFLRLVGFSVNLKETEAKEEEGDCRSHPATLLSSNQSSLSLSQATVGIPAECVYICDVGITCDVICDVTTNMLSVRDVS